MASLDRQPQARSPSQQSASLGDGSGGGDGPIPDDEAAADALPLPLSQSVMLSALPRDAKSALEGVDLGENRKVKIRFQPIGAAPQLQQKVFKISASNRFETVVSFLRRKLGVRPEDSVVCYINQVFAPGLDEGVGGLFNCFKTGSGGDEQLTVHYAMTPAFGGYNPAFSYYFTVGSLAMAVELKIQDSDLEPIQDAVVIITGGSSGIGLATAEILLQLGASVVSGDIHSPKEDSMVAKHANFTHVYCDVTVWTDQTALFSAALTKHGRIDHVFANAGVGDPQDFVELEEVDGEIPQPKHPMLAINFIGQVYTAQLGIHYLKKSAEGGSIVVNSSAIAFSSFGVPGYTAGKYGTLGLVRSLTSRLRGQKYFDAPAANPSIPAVRVNAVAPSWTRTAIVPEEMHYDPAFRVQDALPVARMVIVQMADRKRYGEIVFIREGRFFEMARGFGAAMSQLFLSTEDPTPQAKAQ